MAKPHVQQRSPGVIFRLDNAEMLYRSPPGGMPMATMSDVSIINWNKTEAKPVASGLERTICSQALCGSKYLTVYQRTVQDGRQLDVQAGGDYHLVYVIEAPKGGTISFNGKSHAAEDGAGVLLVPGESASFEASASDLQMLHMVTPKPPAAVEAGLPG